MKRKEFLEKLRRRLVVLKSEEIEDIIVEYGGYIDEKVKKGKTEEQAISEFGDFNELVKEILSAYKINDEGTTAKNVIMNFFDDLAKIFENIANDLHDKEPEQILKFVVEIVLLIILIGICRIPVEIIIHLGKNIFNILPVPLYGLLYGIWRFLFEIAYLVLAVLFFLKIFKQRFWNYDSKESKTTTKTNSKSKKNTKVKEKEIISETKEKDVYKNNYSTEDDYVSGVFLIIAKILVAFILIPSIASLVGFIVAFGLGVGLVISGVHYFGFLICLFALMQFGIFFVELMFNFVFGRKTRPAKMLGSLVFAIICMGVGVSIAAFEFINTSYIDTVPAGFIKTEKLVGEYEQYQINDITEWYNTEYIVDETVKDKIVVKIEYYENFIKMDGWLHDSSLYFSEDYRLFSPKEIYKTVVENLKNKEIYNYTELYRYHIKVYANQNNINHLKNYWD